VLDGYDVVGAMEYPSDDSLKDREGGYDAVMMTGSQHTAHDDKLPWLGKLISFVGDLARNKDTQHVKIIGICFGMQVCRGIFIMLPGWKRSQADTTKPTMSTRSSLVLSVVLVSGTL
jgi:hypothetical protein